MPSHKPLTIERLREVLDYNPETGVFVWKSPSGRRVKQGDVANNLGPYGYKRVRIDNKLYLQHHLVFFIHNGRWPVRDIDHINRIKSDNRISNLREVTRTENNHNKPVQRNNTCGYPGIEWVARVASWRSRIVVFKKRIDLGYFKDLGDAIAARKQAEQRLLPHIYKPAGIQRSA